jgi:hypothetical protein
VLEARMSRTDKDRPYNVRAADSHERGRYVHHGISRYWWRLDACTSGDGCDLPDYHDRTPEPTWHRRNSGQPTHNCTWELEHWVFSPYGGSSPKWFTDSIWHNPERVRERDTLRGAAREWNAHGEIDDFDFANYQGRHCATWAWE